MRKYVKVDTKGIARKQRQLEYEAELCLAEMRNLLARYLQEKSTENKTGREYTHPITKQPYKASAKTEYPAAVTGMMSVFIYDNNRFNPITGRAYFYAYSKAPYAKFYTRPNPLRPFIKEAILDLKPEFDRIWSRLKNLK